jgi:hypothetical protein
MGFFARGRDDDPDQAEDLARIEAGGIPRSAAERLQGLAAGGAMFTSGLSVNEFALPAPRGCDAPAPRDRTASCRS